MKLDFEKMGGLIPAVVQDADTQAVLMVGFMNPAAWEKTVETGCVTFYSRTRDKLWTKGETSGHVLKVQEVLTDCDLDTVVVRATPVGPGVCHEGYSTCFSRRLGSSGDWERFLEPCFDAQQVYGGTK